MVCKTIIGGSIPPRASKIFNSLSIHPIDRHQSRFPFRISQETTPRPVLRMFHQSTLHWIIMHVLQFLSCLPLLYTMNSLEKPWVANQSVMNSKELVSFKSL
jgi:hypothetical protein